MSIRVANNRFITSSFAGFYQQIFSNSVTLQELGSWLISQAEAAQVFRKRENLEEISTILCNFPIKEVQTIGQYYKGLCAHHRGEDAQHVFEQVVGDSRTYRAKALMSLAAVEARKRNSECEHYYFLESIKYADNISLVVEASRCIAVVKAKEGFHQHSVEDFERILPLIKYGNAHSYFQCLNSYAVELGEVGRIEEAQNVCRITLASPFINAYPEWRETWQDLALRGYKSRSVVSVPELPLKVKDNVVPMPANTNPSPIKKGLGKVLDLQKLRKKMVKEPNGENEDIKNMDEKDLFLKLMQLSTQDDITRKKLLKIVEYALKVTSEPD